MWSLGVVVDVPGIEVDLQLLDAIVAVSNIVLVILLAFVLLDPGWEFRPGRAVVAVTLGVAGLGVLPSGLSRALSIRSLHRHQQLAQQEASELSATIDAAQARRMARPRRP